MRTMLAAALTEQVVDPVPTATIAQACQTSQRTGANVR